MLSAYKDSSLYDSEDPIWKRRHSIKLDDGEKNPTFHYVINDIIEEYLQFKKFRRAIGLRLFLGAFSRNDKYLIHHYQHNDHEMLLRQNLVVAGMEKRLILYGL